MSEFGGFNVDFNVLNNELEKSSLNNNEPNGPHTATNTMVKYVQLVLDYVILIILDVYLNGNIDDNGLQYDVSFGM